MPDATQEKLRLLLAKSQAELQGTVGRYGTLLDQLEVLQRSLEADDLNHEVLDSTRRAFPMKLQSVRAAEPADDLPETRKLLVELNHLVEELSRKK